MKQKKDDFALWQKWKQEMNETGVTANEHWEPLVKKVAIPAARSFVAKFRGKTDIPEATIYSHALRNAQQGILQWDPEHKSGANLFSFVTNAVNFGSNRFVQKAQTAGERVPSHRGGQARTEYISAKERFEGEYEYEPSPEELASYILKQKTDYPSLNKLINKKNAKDYMIRFEEDLRKGAPGTAEVLTQAVSNPIPNDDLAIAEVKYQLTGGTPREQEMLRVLELKLQQVPGGEIAKRLGISASKVSNLSNKLIAMIQKEQRRRRGNT